MNRLREKRIKQARKRGYDILGYKHPTDPWSVYVPPRSYKLEGKSSLDLKL